MFQSPTDTSLLLAASLYVRASPVRKRATLARRKNRINKFFHDVFFHSDTVTIADFGIVYNFHFFSHDAQYTTTDLYLNSRCRYQIQPNFHDMAKTLHEKSHIADFQERSKSIYFAK